mgnify:CR=1 FL=1
MKVLVTVVPSGGSDSGRIEYSRPAEFGIIEEPSEVKLGIAICAFLDTFQNQRIRSHSVTVLEPHLYE